MNVLSKRYINDWEWCIYAKWLSAKEKVTSEAACYVSSAELVRTGTMRGDEFYLLGDFFSKKNQLTLFNF